MEEVLSSYHYSSCLWARQESNLVCQKIKQMDEPICSTGIEMQTYRKDFGHSEGKKRMEKTEGAALTYIHDRV